MTLWNNPLCNIAPPLFILTFALFWELHYCESLMIKGHWYWCLKVFQTQNHQRCPDLLVPRQYSERLNNSWNYPANPTRLMRVLARSCMHCMIACVGMVALCSTVPPIRGFSALICVRWLWFQILKSEWAAQVFKNRCGWVYNFHFHPFHFFYT